MLSIQRSSGGILSTLAGLAVVGELLTALIIEVPLAAITFAGLFLAGWIWLRTGTKAPVAYLAILFGIELAFVPFYTMSTALEVVSVVVAVMISLGGLIAAIVEFTSVRGAERSAP